jgi:hypothetical protein
MSIVKLQEIWDLHCTRPLALPTICIALYPRRAGQQSLQKVVWAILENQAKVAQGRDASRDSIMSRRWKLPPFKNALITDCVHNAMSQLRLFLYMYHQNAVVACFWSLSVVFIY